MRSVNRNAWSADARGQMHWTAVHTKKKIRSFHDRGRFAWRKFTVQVQKFATPVRGDFYRKLPVFPGTDKDERVIRELIAQLRHERFPILNPPIRNFLLGSDPEGQKRSLIERLQGLGRALVFPFRQTKIPAGEIVNSRVSERGEASRSSLLASAS